MTSRQKKLLIGVGLLLLIGVLVWLFWPTSRNREPFDQALADLACAKGVLYSDTLTSNLGTRQVTVTHGGQRFGTSDWETDVNDVLLLDGTFYTKPISRLGKRYDQPDAGKWHTGDPSDDKVYGENLANYAPPKDMADRFSAALRDLSLSDLPTVAVNGVPALRADTAAGSLFVAKEAPYRVLRMEPLLNALLQGTTFVPPGSHDPGLPLSKGTDLTPLSGARAEQMYDTLEKYTSELADAVDDSLRFDNKSGDVQCTVQGCTATERFTGTVAAGAKTRTGSQVSAALSSKVTINGRDVGSCTSQPGNFQFVGNTVRGELTCSVPQAGSLIAGARSWHAVSLDHVTAFALSHNKVDELLALLHKERGSAACPG